MGSLKPEKTSHLYLLSSTAHFFGEHESERLLLTHAWQHRETLSSCRFFVLAVRIEEAEPDQPLGVRTLPDYSYIGELSCAYLSVLFGKRFDNHGMIQGSGMFHAPVQGLQTSTLYPLLGPNNNEPRKTMGFDLDLGCFEKLEPLYTRRDLNSKADHIFSAASRLYLRSLRSFDNDAEAAMIDLVACGELLSGFYSYSESDLYDDTLKQTFDKIKTGYAGGTKAVNQIKGRLRQIKRCYLITILRLLTPDFFTTTEAIQSYGALKKDNIDVRISESYNLRSQYVHTGSRFGSWMYPRSDMMNEIQIGIPVIKDNKALGKAIGLSPTYIGLERIMRYCLLRFLHLNLTPIDSRLDGLGLIDNGAHL